MRVFLSLPMWAVLGALGLSSGVGLGAGTVREQAYRDNNLGVALMEQFRFAEAVQAFERALETDPSLDLARVNLVLAHFYVPDHEAARREAEAALVRMPDSPQLNYVMGLIARGEGRAEEAVPHLLKVLAQDPRDVGANLALGQAYLQMRRFDEAARVFETAAEAEPYNVSTVYNLGVALNRAGRREEAARALERFQELRESAYKTSLGSAYMEQGKYAEALSSTGAEEDNVDPRTPDVSFVERDPVAASASAPPSPGPVLGTPVTPGEAAKALPRAALVLADLDGDGALDVVESGLPGLRVLRNGGQSFRDVTVEAGLAGVPAMAVVAGDEDNDGHPDLLVLRPEGLSLFRNDGAGGFHDISAAAGLPPWPFLSATATLVDIDHDGDLDLLVGGLADLSAAPSGEPAELPTGYPEAPLLLLQNDGDGTFTDVTERARLVGTGHVLAVVPTDFDNRRDVDLLVVHADAPPSLFKNLRDGSFRDVASEVGLVAEGPFTSVAAGDLNKDGYVDFFLGGAERSWLALSDGRAAFEVSPAPDAVAGAQAAQLVDYDYDGLLDLLVMTAQGPRLMRNLGATWTDVSEGAFSDVFRESPLVGAALGVGDLDGDGDQDGVVATPASLHVLESRGVEAARTFTVELMGRVSNVAGVGNKIEIRAGALRQKQETSAAVPMVAPADVVFGLGGRVAPDAVRVIWVSGIVQTETDFPATTGPGHRTALDVMELDRKPSSCPYLYAWNGERFAFVTDFLGGGEMGYGVAPRVWNHPDPVEYVRLAPEQLRPRDGRYELRVTNELEEVLYLDRVGLLVVDHPDDVSVHPDEGMTEPPKALRLFAARDPRTPRATGDRGQDVTARLARLDRLFVDELPLEEVRGYAREHALTLDLSDLSPSHTLLLLTGWTDYAFSSDNVAAHQAGLVLAPPRLEVEGASGAWETVVEQIGIPVGRPQTVVVDLEGVELGPRRRVRVVTSMRVYWDEAKVAVPAPSSGLEPAVLEPLRADLRERGFSAETSPDGREPFGYDYTRVSWRSPWKTLPGLYTREGDVRPLLASTDDAFVISKPGDELALSFDATALPEPPAGWTRTFLFLGDGFSKEMDINSASPDAVRPLPWHGMPSYPYDADAVPAAARARWDEMEPWLTRRVVEPMVPLDLYAFGDR